MPPHASGCAALRHVPLGEPRSDAWAGELERKPEVVTCRGKWLAAAAVLPCLRACRSSGLAGARGAPWRASIEVPWFGLPGELLSPGPWRFGLVVSASSSCRGLVFLARQAPLAGALSSWPGKLLLPGPRLLGSNTCSPFGPRRGRRGSWRSPGEPCRRVLLLSVHKFGVLRYPYFSTPTGAPGPGPYTVPSVVGPGPNSARARVAWVALLLNSAPAAPSPSGARLSRRRGGEACEACVTWVACAGLRPAGMRHVEHDKEGRFMLLPYMGGDVEAWFGRRMGSRRSFRGVRSPRSRVG